MAVLEILTFPDPRLRIKAKPVDKVTPEMVQLAKDMLETMYKAPGIGLAAPQVGQSIRLLVVDTRPRDLEGRYEITDMTELEKQVQFPITIFNPEIKKKTGKTTYNEGCLSVPGFFETVERAEYIEMEGLDASGQPLRICTDGLLAICLQHELDHLEGKLFIDRLSFLKSSRIKDRILKFGYEEGDEKDDVAL